MSQTLISLLLQPTLYTVAIAVILAFYLVWALAKQQYLGVFQQFDVLAISLAVGVAGIFVAQILFPGYWSWPWPPQQILTALKQPFTIVALVVGYSLAGLASWWHIRRLHYPFWRVMDSNSLGLSVIQLGWLLGVVLQELSVSLAIATVVWAILVSGLLIMYHKTDRPGLTASLHVVALFGFCLVLQRILVSWQGYSSIVEYAIGGLGLIGGMVALLTRWRVTVPRPTLSQLPAGVSQKFRDTFTRSLGVKQPSKPDGSSGN
jgi:hypothetical protein